MDRREFIGSSAAFAALAGRTLGAAPKLPLKPMLKPLPKLQRKKQTPPTPKQSRRQNPKLSLNLSRRSRNST